MNQKPDAYLFGQVLGTYSFLLKDGFLQPDEYAEIQAQYFLPGGETGTAATVLDAQGYYSKEPRTLLLTVMTRPQAVQLNAYIKQVDPGAFMTVSNISTIIGKGFRSSL